MALPTKRDRITEIVRQWLNEGRYRPGDRFPSDQELAREFNVTHVTVRAALRPLVEARLIERRIGWGTVVADPLAPKPAAREGLAAAVGVAIPDTTHSFFNEILRAIEAALHERQRPLVLGHTWDLPAREETILGAWASQGLEHVIVAPSGGCTATYEALLRRGTRLVFVDRDEPALDVAAVTSRDQQGAHEVSRRLFAGGGTVCHLAGPAGASTARARREGFAQAQREAGQKGNVIPAGFYLEDGYRAMRTQLDQGPPPRAVFAANDPVAVGALRALAERGIEVPGDVRVAGYGDTDLARSFDLTSVRQFPETMGSEAVRLLLCPERPGRSSSLVLEPEVVERGSTGLAPAQRRGLP